jgi:tyrocidine synthetase III
MTAKFDLTFMVFEKEDALKCTLEYCTRLFKEETIRRFIACYKKLVSSVIASPGQLISAIEIIPDEEKQSILYEFNNTWVDYPGDKTIHQLFEEQVEKTPDQVGVVGPVGQIELTYRQLHDQSDLLAALLIEKGVLVDNIVAIKMERSVEMIIGIMGILKAGGAYLPIEPDYPRERIDYMLKDSGARFLINEKFFGGLYRRGDFSKKPPGNVQLAYVIYTSGSTGLPKGTVVEHKSAVNLLFAMQRKYPLLERDTYLLKTSYMFDVSVTELFGWFFEGGKLVILEKDGEKDPNAILANIERHYITHINFVPPMFNAFIEIMGPGSIGKLSSLKYIFLAGEALLAELVERFRRYGLAVSVENIYGPTEGTVYSAWYSLGEWCGGSVPIGKPLPNVELLVLDRAGNLQPVGVPGELCITGVGLARGYLNNPELTTERFIKNRSYRTNKTYIGYKTGDLARWLPDGNIEFLGRMDYQVKVRGFRIELGEIEGQLLKHPGIKEAVVLLIGTQTEDKSLCAYVGGDVPGGAEELRQYLSRTLPYYMVPTDFVFLERLPLNVSGKIDRKALPVPGIKTGAGYVAPANTIEKKLVEIWSEVMGIDRSRIGVEDNFFLLGGHSLRAASMAARIHRELGFKIALTQVFKTSTIRGLARALGLMNPDKYNTVEPVEEKEYYALSAAQKRLYILQCMDPANTGYNMPEVFHLEGNVDLARLTKIFIKLISRHESLRTSFIMVKGEPVQKIHHEVYFEIEQELSINHFIRAFELSNAPLLRVGLQKVEEEKFILMMDMHHIITDGASTAILINDLTGFYEGKKLPTLNLHYRDFAEWQNRLLKSGEIKRQEEYWLTLYAAIM